MASEDAVGQGARGLARGNGRRAATCTRGKRDGRNVRRNVSCGRKREGIGGWEGSQCVGKVRGERERGLREGV